MEQFPPDSLGNFQPEISHASSREGSVYDFRAMGAGVKMTETRVSLFQWQHVSGSCPGAGKTRRTLMVSNQLPYT
jgi:hypothetical protein